MVLEHERLYVIDDERLHVSDDERLHVSDDERLHVSDDEGYIIVMISVTNSDYLLTHYKWYESGNIL